MLAADAEAKKEYVAGDPCIGSLNGHQRSETTHTEPRFRTLLTEDGNRRLEFKGS